MFRQFSLKKHIYLDNFKILFPDKHHTYHIKPPGTDQEVVIKLRGTRLRQYAYFDFASGLYLLKNEDTERYQRFEDYILFTNLQPFKKPMLYGVSSEGTIFQHKKIILREDKSYFGMDLEAYSYSKPYKIINQDLKRDSQKALPQIKVKVSDYPILSTNYKISHALLESIYQKFIQYNRKKKLGYQNANSVDQCHIRAHFVSLILESAGLQTIKVVKKWKRNSWKAFLPLNHSEWNFHVAAASVDENNKVWVWDPWVGKNPTLLTLSEWLFRQDEPVPTQLLITSSMVVTPAHENTPWPDFVNLCPTKHMKAFQATFSSAIPNPPERPISYSFFKTQVLDAAEKKITAACKRLLKR